MSYGTLAEKKALVKKSGYWALGAVLFAILSVLVMPMFVSPQNEAFTLLLLPSQLLSAALWLVGCCYYAKSKGWSPAMGVLGVLTLIGVLVLVLLPDKWRKALKEAPAPSGPTDLTNYPRTGA